MIVRALLAFLALPGLVAFVVPLLLGWPALRDGSFAWIGLVALVPGVALLLWCVREFLVNGKGTLAPWDPPRHLVTSGAYRSSRNPMYVAVTLVLLGWTIGFASWPLLIYTLVVAGAFHLRVVFFEEPWLARTHREQWPRYAARVPRWVFRSRRAIAYTWLAVLATLPVGGLIYEAYADGQAGLEFTPPGMLVDVGGRRLHLLCIGDGEPTVIFEASSFGSSLSSARARERIASRATVCSYDRAGMGWSDPSDGPMSFGGLARDLAVLQDRGRLRWPFIIVSSSMGGMTAELFAREFPERVAGLVFLDAASSRTLARREELGLWVRAAACTGGVLSHFGVIRLLDPFGFRQEDSDAARRGAALAYNTRVWNQLCAFTRGLPDTVRDFEQAPPLPPDLPLTVLSASTSEEMMPAGVARFVDVERLRSESRTRQQELARQSSRGHWELVPDSTHLIASSQPDVVAEAVFAMIEQVR
jgi:protein-S-isoprenylcysteine O-methyltransferase Ste14/pimeloyl-ACP methyl ester carboxylesterase